MGFFNWVKPVSGFLVNHSNVILAGVAVSGTIGTAVLAAKEAPIARDRLDDLYSKCKENETPAFRDKFRAVFPVYLPAIGTGLITCGAIVGNAKIASARQAILGTALASSEKALMNYQNKVTEMFGKEKEQSVRKEIAEDKIRNDIHQTGAQPVFIETGKGTYPCYDAQFDRYFYSSIETIKGAVNTVNAEVNGSWDNWCTLNRFYEELNLPPVMFGDAFGFNHDNPMGIKESDANYTGLPITGTPTFILEFVNRPVLYNGKKVL